MKHWASVAIVSVIAVGGAWAQFGGLVSPTSDGAVKVAPGAGPASANASTFSAAPTAQASVSRPPSRSSTAS
jgi:hypothetical protein